MDVFLGWRHGDENPTPSMARVLYGVSVIRPESAVKFTTDPDLEAARHANFMAAHAKALVAIQAESERHETRTSVISKMGFGGGGRQIPKEKS